MSDTPEIDAAELYYDGPTGFVPIEDARKVERKLNEALESGGITFLLAEKHALENELEAMTCKAAGWQNQAELNARLLVESREKAERYRLEANAMMAKLHELQTYADKLADGLPEGMLPKDVENLRSANAGLAEDLRRAQQERDEALSQIKHNHKGAEMLEQMVYSARQDRDQWRKCAERLAQRLNWWAGPPQQIGGHHESMVALQEFERLKEASK